MLWLEQVLRWAHGLSGAAWFGAIFYRTFVVDPKAHAFFVGDEGAYERFSVHFAHGMRYVVWPGLLTCGGSGLALAALHWRAGAAHVAWVSLVVAKVLTWAAAVGLFAYVSYVHWPWRSLAAPAEFGHYRRQAQRLATAMFLLAGAGFILGQAWRVVSVVH